MLARIRGHADRPHEGDGDHAEDAIDRHRGHGRAALRRALSEGIGTSGIAADAGRQEAADKRTDQEDPRRLSG